MRGIDGGRADAHVSGWAQGLGEARHAREEGAARAAKSRTTEAERMTAVSIERWAGIVGSIRRLADAYNAGARRVILRVAEQPGQPTVTLATGGEGTPFLTAVLEDTLIRTHGRDSAGTARATEIRLRADRDDDATAAYVLQDWMQRL